MKLLEMSLSGAVLIAAAVLIRAATLRRLPKIIFPVLWELAVFRLLVPFTVPSGSVACTPAGRGLSAPSFLEMESGGIFVLPRNGLFPEQGMERFSTGLSPVSVWFSVWCAGMILCAAYFLISYLRCRMEFRTSLPVYSAFTERWLKEQTLKRRISVRQSDRIRAPLTYGLFRPVILMPKQTDWEDTEQLQYIFAHEYAHIRRLDAAAKLAAAIAFCVHWFNPFVWVMCRFFNRDMELACDECVVRQFGETSKAPYARMLICMEEKKSGLQPFCSRFCKNAGEERITAIMNTKRTTPAVCLSACLTVSVAACLFAASAAAFPDSGRHDVPAVRSSQTNAEASAADQRDPAPNTEASAADRRGPAPNTEVSAADRKGSMSIIHESAEILRYEDGSPYIHDILTNETDQTMVETQYGMLAYDEYGTPLKLYWNFLDSSAESSFEYMVRTREHLPPGGTEEYRGGWSLYDEGTMEEFLTDGNGGANQAAYALLCLKQVVFDDGTVWNNPDYENWLGTYAGKETDVDDLQNYYPYEYRVESRLR